jgi:hypothetical protein
VTGIYETDSKIVWRTGPGGRFWRAGAE